MAGTKAGGLAAATTNKQKYGEDFYAKIGSLGGTQTYKSGKLELVSFASNRERARVAGKKGGHISKRRKI